MEDNFSVFIQTSKVFEAILFLTRMIREMRIGNAILQKINYMNRILQHAISFLLRLEFLKYFVYF